MMEGDTGPSSQSPSENEPLNRTENDRTNKPGRKTLQHFFMKASEQLVEASMPEPDDPCPQQHRKHNLARHALNRELTGRLHPWATSRAQATFAQGYREATFIDSHPWRTPVLGAAHNAPPSGFIQCAQFDSTGELLITGSDDGSVLVHSGESLQNAAWNASFSSLNTRTIRTSTRDGIDVAIPGSAVKVDPLLALYSGLPKVHHVRWNPTDENVIATACATTKTVHLFDLQQTQGRPKQSLSLPMQISGGAGDIAFFSGSSGGNSVGGNGGNTSTSSLPGSGYTLLIGGPTGQAFIWDIRMSGPPAVTLHSTRGGAVTSIALIENDHAVVAATQGGDIKAWDLRGGSGGALRFGGVLHHHPILTAVDLRSALLEVPNLAEQAGNVLPLCAVHGMILSPRAPHRAGFHLGCGWSGVLDLRSKRITHLHAPPRPLVDEQPTAADGAQAMVLWAQMAAPHLRRRACWTADGRRFAVPSRQKDALLLLDFEESKHAGCYALLEDEDELLELDFDDDTGGGSKRISENREGEVAEEQRLENVDESIAAMDVDDRLMMMRREYSSKDGQDSEGESLEERSSSVKERVAQRKRNPSAVEIPLSQAAICAAAMPVNYTSTTYGGGNSGENNVIVAGGAHNFLSLVLP